MKVLKKYFDDFDDGSVCTRWYVAGCSLAIRLYRPDNTVALFDGDKILFCKSYSCYSSAFRSAKRLINKYFGGDDV